MTVILTAMPRDLLYCIHYMANVARGKYILKTKPYKVYECQYYEVRSINIRVGEENNI